MSADWRAFDDDNAQQDDPYTAAARACDDETNTTSDALDKDFEHLSIDQHTLVNDLLDDDEYDRDDVYGGDEGNRSSEHACA